MYQKFSELRFVIGLFFTILSIILFGNALFRQTLSGISLYTPVTFLIFGLAMMFAKARRM